MLGVATFAAVRSANRSSRISEEALAVSMRPVLVQSRDDDPAQPLMWLDQRWGTILGGHGYVEHTDDVVYLAMLVRNVGSGIAVLQAWRAIAALLSTADDFGDPDDFRPPDPETCTSRRTTAGSGSGRCATPRTPPTRRSSRPSSSSDR